MKLITIKEVTQILGVTQKTFYQLKKRYGFNTYMGDGKINLYDEAEIIEFKETPKNKRKEK